MRQLLGLISQSAWCVMLCCACGTGGCSSNAKPQPQAEVATPPSSVEIARPKPPQADPELLASRAASHGRMLDELAQLGQRMQLENPYLGENATNELRSALDRLETLNRAPSVQKWQILEQLGRAELRLGKERDAIDHFQSAYHVGKAVPSQMPSGSASDTFFSLGVAFMRLGETDNCCVQNGPESCLFPIRPSAYHTKIEGSSEAIRALELALKLTPPNSARYKQSQWLLNIAQMTLGHYPDGVSSEYLIPPEAFAPTEHFPPFPNVAKQAGINTFSLSGGAVAEDFDNDGDFDLLVSSWEHTGQLRLFSNDGHGAFTERTKEANLTGLCGGLNMIQGDFNNDGHVDVFLLRGAWLAKYGRHPNSLLRNNGDGTFSDITFQAGLAESSWPTQTAAWADYDLDGDLDLYVGNEPVGSYSRDLSTEKFTASQLFRNNGDETFTDVAVAAGVTNDRYAKGVVWGDFDNDRWPDIYVSNLKAENRLYHNNGNGTFTDVSRSLNVTGPELSFPTWFWDFDNDGMLDIFVSAYDGRTEDLVDYYLKRPVDAARPRLYRRDANGYTDVAEEMRLTLPSLPMGCNFGDLDNDGFLDFYLGTGDPNYHQLMPNLMYLNKSGRRFVDVTVAGGFGNLQKGHGVVFADFDNDGDQDVFEEMGGAFLGDRYYDILYQNPGFGNNWLAIQLVGIKSNRSAIGARIRVDVMEDADQPESSRSIHRRVNSGGSFGANPLRQHIGIGRATRVSRIEVYWPASDTTQVVEGVQANRMIRIVEGM